MKNKGSNRPKLTNKIQKTTLKRANPKNKLKISKKKKKKKNKKKKKKKKIQAK